MTTLRAFDLLLRIKRRRVDQLEEAVRERIVALQARQSEHEQAVAQEQACAAQEADCVAKISHLSSRPEGFRPSDLIALQHVLDTLADHTKRAAQATAQAQQQVEAAQQAVQEARYAKQRAESQVEQLEERREQLARQIEQAQEDQQDEDSEETAVARMLAQAQSELCEASA